MEHDAELLAAEFDDADDAEEDVPDYAKASTSTAYPSVSSAQTSAVKYPSVIKPRSKNEGEPVKRTVPAQAPAALKQQQPIAAPKQATTTAHKSNKDVRPNVKAPSRAAAGSNDVHAAAPSSVTAPELKAVASKWKDVLVHAGLGLEYAWKYGLALSEAGFDESNAEGLRETDLIGLGIEKQTDRLNILKTIKEIASEMRASHSQDAGKAQSVWEALLRRARLGSDWTIEASQYARLLAKGGWNETNVENMTEENLEELGISNAAHREVIMQLIEREIAEARANPDNYRLPSDSEKDDDDDEEYVSPPKQTTTKSFVPSLLDPSKPFSKKDVKEVERVRREVANQLEAFEEFEQRLHLILSGDTDLQREQRARREAEKERRKTEREQKRIDRLIARTVRKAGGE